MKTYRHKKDFKPGELIKHHQDMLKKGKAPKGESLAVERAELKLLKKGAKKGGKK
jgi:hypothetical protein